MKIIKADIDSGPTVADLKAGDIFLYWSTSEETWWPTPYLVVDAKEPIRNAIMPKDIVGITIMDLTTYEITWLSNYHKVKIYKDSELHLK